MSQQPTVTHSSEDLQQKSKEELISIIISLQTTLGSSKKEQEAAQKRLKALGDAYSVLQKKLKSSRQPKEEEKEEEKKEEKETNDKNPFYNTDNLQTTPGKSGAYLCILFAIFYHNSSYKVWEQFCKGLGASIGFGKYSS